MAENTERLNDSPKGTDRLQNETSKLSPEGTDRLGGESTNVFPTFFKEGDIVKGRYKVINKLGQPGGEAIVYLCLDTENKREGVLKLYHQGFSAKEEVIKVLANITHKDVINVLDYGDAQGQFFEVMDYAAGGSLQDRLKDRPFSEEELAKHVIPEVLNGLIFCHENRIIHRDIKPGNLFYRDKDQTDIVLGDFGISSLLDQKMTSKKTKGAMTFDFAAPEMFGWKGEHYISFEVDYYALGITLIYLFLGRSPFHGLTDLQIFTKHTSEKLVHPDKLSERFKILLAGLLIKERKKRWGASEVKRWLKGEDVPVYEDVLDGEAQQRIRPYKLTEDVKANSSRELAILLQTHKDIKLLRERLARKSFSQWLEPFDQTMADAVSRVEEKVKNADLALLEISCILDPTLPYFVTPEIKAESPQELASIFAKKENWELGKEHFASGRIKVWLQYTPGGNHALDRWNKLKK